MSANDQIPKAMADRLLGSPRIDSIKYHPSNQPPKNLGGFSFIMLYNRTKYELFVKNHAKIAPKNRFLLKNINF